MRLVHMLSYISSDTHMSLFVTKIFIFEIIHDKNITNDEDCDATTHQKILFYLLDFKKDEEICRIELKTSKRITESLHDFLLLHCNFKGSIFLYWIFLGLRVGYRGLLRMDEIWNIRAICPSEWNQDSI